MKMIVFKRAKEQLIYNNKTIWAWNKIRSLENKKRLLTEVVFSEPVDGDPKPYDPKLFPIGTWSVFLPTSKTDKYLSPFFIPTDAKQIVETYSVADGFYLKKNGTQMDSGYGIHFSTSSTTLGCIRIANEKDLLDLVQFISECIKSGETVKLTVME